MAASRILVSGLVLVFLLAGCARSETPAKTTPSRAPGCSAESWIGGTTELCGGALIYRDYVYDDHGAGSSPVNRSPIGGLSPRAGDATYPAGAENTADLVFLELAPHGNELRITAELNTLYAPDSTLLAVAIDADNNSDTGGGDWPLNAAPNVRLRSDGWEVIQVFGTGDPATNLITGSVPLPDGKTWRVQAAVAQADGTVMNVAFRGQDEIVGGVGGGGTWWEDRQAEALASGDISEFGTVVELKDLRSQARRSEPVGPGLHQRVYTSKYTLGEGISVEGIPGRHGDTGNVCEQYFNFLGKYQPYGIYLPKELDGTAQAGPHGIQFALHGCSANHASLIDGEGMQGRFGDDLNRIILVPLGRGPFGFYSDISERDVLDVLADVLTNYDIDRDRIFSGGYSMGGYGTLRFAALYPDLFAGAVNWVGFTGDAFNTPVPDNPGPGFSDGDSASGGVGNVIDFIGNLRHIPTASLYSGEDELVHASSGLAMMQAFDAAQDVVYEFYFHPAAEHLTYAVLDNWIKEATYSSTRQRVHNPQRVIYRTLLDLAYPEYGIRHDRAYWISAIAAHDPLLYSDVDLSSLGCRNDAITYEEGSHAGPDPVPWFSEFREITGATPGTTANRIEGTLANVAALTVDTAGACLGGRAVGYKIATDSPVTISLSDGRRLSLPAGTHEGSF